MQLFYNNAGRTPYNATLWLKRLVRDLSLKQKDTQAIVEQLQQQQLTELAGEALQQELQQKEGEQEKKEQEKGEQENEQQLRSTRDVSLNMDLLDIVGVSNTDNNNNNNSKDGGKKKVSRTKRQSSGRSTLCETTSQFITPQAALNSRGNWMFVVNEENTARQMVKAELCA